MQREADGSLQETIDRLHIGDIVTAYATCVDARDWDRFRTLFADEIELDFSSHNGMAPSSVSTDTWVQRFRDIKPGFDATQHQLSNLTFDIRGDEATVTVYVTADHFLRNPLGDDRVSLGGYYTHVLRRADGKWKIRKCKLTVRWNAGNRHIYQLATQGSAGTAKE